ncbi:MAG: ATP-binding protein [Roseobacter sp.]
MLNISTPRKAYSIGLVLIAVLVTLQFAGTRFVTQKQAVSAIEINLAGRQRMLSQRIGFTLFQIASVPALTDPERLSALRGLLAECVDLMERSYRALNRRALTDLEVVLDAGDACLAPNPETPLAFPQNRVPLSEESLLADFTQSAWSVAVSETNGTEALQTARAFEGPLLELLSELDQATLEAQTASTAQLKRLLSANWFLLLALIIGEVFLIFRPMSKAVEQSMRRLRHANLRLSNSEARLQSFASIGAHQFWETDANHCFTSLEAADPNTRLLTASDQIGKAPWEIDGLEPHSGVDWDALKRAMANHQSIDGFEYPLWTKYARKTWWRIHGQPVFTQDGTFQGYVGTSLEITNEREAGEKLRLSERMTTIGHLTAGVAHDFNNLLAVIQGNAEMLPLEKNDAARKRDAAEIVAAAGRGASLTSRLLSFGRVQRLAPEPIDVTEFLADLEELLGRTLGEDFEVVVAPPLHSMRILADQHQLQDALLNLAINARDAARSGGQLHIKATLENHVSPLHELTEQDTHSALVKLSFHDNGPGIPANIQERIFEPFFTTKPVGEGSGLGLSMVYGFAHQSGGFLEVDSAAGKGTTIDLYLPSAGGAEKPKASPQDAAQLVPSARLSVLLVEDNDALRSVVRRQLEHLEFDVDEARDGKTAMDKLKYGGPFDILLLDVVLPGGIDGVAVAKFAKEINADARILFCTGFTIGRSKFEQQGKVLGPVLNKPFSMEELKDQLALLTAQSKNGTSTSNSVH